MWALSIALVCLVSIPNGTSFSSSSSARNKPASRLSQTFPAKDSHWMDVLNDGTTPSFDVIQKTKEYTSTAGYRAFNLKEIPTHYYSDEYIFRGPLVGPVNRKDLVAANTAFELDQAYPDLDRAAFGFCVDPENPYRVLFFERWTGTNTGRINIAGVKLPPTGRRSVQPVMPFSIVWTPQGTIIYEMLTTAVDRFEGNTMGKVAVFGLLETAGLSLNNGIGNRVTRLQQKAVRLFNGPAQTFSRQRDIPRWWKSKSRGADPNDM
ncbi:hypothetical protein B484DRAFT_449922 [Ochromonadaceae sp. CCMP2298]|nr:hypothetical protein B484DRAFT_449922 [Ochromonadaceae sp. CCMP2298]